MLASKRLAVALFLVLATCVQPSQPQPSQVQGTRITHSSNIFHAASHCRTSCRTLTPMPSPLFNPRTTGAVLDSVYPNVGTAHAFTNVEFNGNGLSLNLPTLGCRFGESVVSASNRSTLSVACATPSTGPGFVVVGFAHITGKTYAPGRDDISRERGYNVFEFVEPWTVSSVFPQETRSSGGQKLFLNGRNVRPDMQCNFGGPSASKGVALEFVSSALAVCEGEPTAQRSTGVLMLQHGSHAAPDGHQTTIRYRATPDVTYTGREAPTLGEDVSFLAKATDESVERVLSWDARVGCQFGGVWVSATGRATPSEIRCVVPASSLGRTQVTVSDLHSLTPLPSVNGTRAAADISNSGRFSLSVRKPVVVDMIVPAAGSQIERDVNEGMVEVFGDHLASDLAPLASFCTRLNDNPQRRFVDRAAAREEVRAKCLVALASGGKPGTERAFRIGFNAVSIAGALTRSRDTTAQYLLQVPPRLFSTTAAAVREGDVVVLIGENFEDEARGVWCSTGPVSERARVESSAVVRCVVSIGEDARGSFGVASTGQVKLGVSSGAVTAPSASNRASMTWVSNPPEVDSVTPNVGLSDGGTRVIIAPRAGGMGAARFHALATSCRFGSIAPVSASSVGADTVECTAPALTPGGIAVGAPYFARVSESEVMYTVVDAASVVVSTTSTMTTPLGGVAHVSAVRAAEQPVMAFGCMFSTSRGDPVPAPDAAGRLLTCAFPVSGPGFTVLDVTVSLSRSPRVRGVADILLARPSPPAVMIRSGHSGEVYVGDAVHLTAGGLGFAEETWCVTVIGDDELKSPAHRVSAAAVTCEVPSTRDDEDHALLDATMDACAAHACGLSTGKAAPTRDAGHLVLGAEKALTDAAPTLGSTAGGTALKLRHAGASIDAARQFSVCHVGTVGPISASTLGIGETMEIECVTPGHAPGAATLSLAKGKGLTGDISFAFVEDDADEAEVEQHDIHVDPPLSIAGSCDDAVPPGDVIVVGDAWSPSDGGAEISLSTGSTTPRPPEACAAHWTACRIGTTWPVLGHLTELGIECVAPAHRPGIVGVSAPKMRFGTSAPFAYRRLPSIVAVDAADATSPESFALAAPKTSPSILPLGASLDVRTPVPLGDSPACVFASHAWAAPPRVWIAAGHGASSVVVKCEVPVAAKTDGALVVERGRVDSIRSATTTFSAFRDIPDCVVEDLSPDSGGARGGVVSNVHASCLWRDGVAAADARAGCLFGAIGPVAASAGFDGDSHVLRCVVPAHAPATVPFAVTLNWRDASFEPFDPVDGARVARAFRFDTEEEPPASADAAADETRLSSAPPPSLANVVPWLAWGGNVLHVAGRDLPTDASAACVVGASLAPASAVSSALILCDPFPAAPSPAASRLAGGVTEISLGVTSAAAPRRAADSTALSVFVLERAAVVGVDVGNGWEQGGGSVSVELNGWAPAGWMDCRFGTVTVHGRAGGSGWRARASSGRAGEWWSETTAAADVECVTPAKQTGRVPVGVSLAHSSSVSFDAAVEYSYL